MEQVHRKDLRLPEYASWLAFITGILYIIITIIGILDLPGDTQPISQPYRLLMEVLILLTAPLMVISMTGIYHYAEPSRKAYGIIAVCMIAIMAAITSSVHFTVLTIGSSDALKTLPQYKYLFSFQWPSVSYALDILAWDWFYGWAMLVAAAIFRKPGLEKTMRILLIASGTLSFAGLAGVMLNNMQVRNIGIIGYGVIGPFIFLIAALLIRRKRLHH